MKRLNLILAVLFALAVICLLTQASFVIADNYETPSEASYSIDEEWYPFIYGYTWVGNLTYHPATADFPYAYISSDHEFYCHHYYEDEDFEIEYRPLLTVWEDLDFYVNPSYHTTLSEYDSETQAMPTDYLDHEETLWVNITDLPAAETGTDYQMFAYTRMLATPDDISDSNSTFCSWGDESLVRFRHTRPPQ
ncbi:hypothetical protein C6501_09965 [Candidatus Poribacteria bacterium]|nr:MAG: hypothetical protein C6501_09965 [Candidatus Poribacteria bacterium]